jgi:sugar phosphate isomerase/epimerase
LATPDKDERRAALLGCQASLRIARELGARVLVIRLGAMPPSPAWSSTVLAFSKGSLRRADRERLQALRVTMSGQALDLARMALDPLLEAAANAEVTVALANRARWFEVPDEVEVGVLLEDFRGAPLAPFYDAAAAHARHALGVDSASFLAAYGKRLVGAWLTDAAGLRGGLPWGYGEVDGDAVVAALPETALRIVHAAPIAMEHEIAHALAM